MLHFNFIKNRNKNGFTQNIIKPIKNSEAWKRAKNKWDKSELEEAAIFGTMSSKTMEPPHSDSDVTYVSIVEKHARAANFSNVLFAFQFWPPKKERFENLINDSDAWPSLEEAEMGNPKTRKKKGKKVVTIGGHQINLRSLLKCQNRHSPPPQEMLLRDCPWEWSRTCRRQEGAQVSKFL